MPQRYILTGRTAHELVASVEEALRRGALRPGDRLPAVRALAASTGLSPTTVAAAYGELRRRGITTGAGRAGTRVRPRPPVSGRVDVDLPAGVRDLRSGQPDPALLPPLPARRPPTRLYGEPAVSPALRAVAERWLGDDGVDASELAVVGGALDGVERVLSAWARPGDRVVVEDPGYAPALDLLAAMGLQAVPVALDDRGVVPSGLGAALDQAPAALLVTPRAQNPTGAAWDGDRRRAVATVLGRHPDLLVIEDDHAGPVAGQPAHTVGGVTTRWATIRSVSKWLGPDMRVAVVAGDAATMGRVQGRQALGTGWVSYQLQDAVAELCTGPGLESLLARATATYTARRTALAEALGRVGLPVSGRSGLTTWVEVDDEVGVVSGLLAAGWAVTAGDRFRIASAPAVRIGHATLTGADADRLATDLAAVLRQPATRRD